MHKILIKLHLVLGGFFLPVGLMFSITGGLYTFGIKGTYDTKTWSVPAPTAATYDLPTLLPYALDVLKTANLKNPTGAAAVKKAGTSWQLEWTGASADFTLEPTETAGQFKAQYKATTLHRYFVQLHKAKGGEPFKILAGAFAVGLILLLISGLMMAFAAPTYLSLALKSIAAGIAVTLIAMYFS